MIPHLYVSYACNSAHSIPLSAVQHHYLVKVMRLKAGHTVHVFNGKQGLWSAQLNGEHLIDLVPLLPQPTEPCPRALFFSPIKSQNWLIEKGTELGVTDFFPIMCQRTGMRHFCPKRHMKIVYEACEQSRRLNIPTIHPIASLEKQLACPKVLKNFGPLGVLTLDASTAMAQSTPMLRGVFVGPEGGWSPEEISLFSKYFTAPVPINPVHLGAAVLRAETAALVACTLMMHLDSSI